jgi:ATPase subunit of ABC transporter with duplicated ATPase domains
MYLGAKIGVLGANGAGKSSLMRILAGVDDKFDGKVVRTPGIRWGRVQFGTVQCDMALQGHAPVVRRQHYDSQQHPTTYRHNCHISHAFCQRHVDHICA